MLHIKINGGEFFNEYKQEFIEIEPQELIMEHSLLSLSKWEEKWKKPFLKNDNKTTEEQLDYIKCMTLTENVNPLCYECLTINDLQKIKDYINDSHTATVINRLENGRSGSKIKVMTNEVIYYAMFANGIPKECEQWHLNRLLTLLNVFAIKNNPKGKKMSRKSVMQQNRAINEARRAKYHTKG